MGRIRTVKPEIAKHELLYDAEAERALPLRFAWVMLFTVADREGRFQWKPRRLKADILPYDTVDFSLVLDALEDIGLIQKYEVDGETYGCIPTWQKHQTINQREAQSSIPPPPRKSRTCTHVQTPDEYVLARGLPNGVNVPKPYAKAVMFRDGDACARCGATENLTIDHIFPQSCGGTHAPMNLRTLCRSCNSARPVAGAALEADLEMDGLTMEDRGRICMHVHARGEGKGKEGNGTSRDHDDLVTLNFERWYAGYPRKEAKLYAEKAWQKLTDADQAAALDALDSWPFPADKKFTPLPASWLNARRWEDEREEADSWMPS